MVTKRTDLGAGESSRVLQENLDRTRDSIAQTVTEIQGTMASEYHEVRKGVSKALDWRAQVDKHPVAFVAGALILGMLAGRRIGSQLLASDDEPAAESSDSVSPSPIESLSTRGPGSAPSRSRGNRLMDSVRRTQVYDQLQSGIGRLLSEVVEEFVKTGREVIIPSVIARFVDKVGIDRNREQRNRA